MKINSLPKQLILGRTFVSAAIAVALFCSLALPACALPAADEGRNETSACFMSAAERHNIPAELLLAVAEVESGLSPNAINLAGTSYQPQSQEAARRLLEKMAKQRATFDVGFMQVNRWWFEKYGEPYEKGLDPCFNIDFGARILSMAIKDHGFTWEAVGRYHSPTSWRKEAYAKRIFSRLSKILEKRTELPIDKYLAQKLRHSEERLIASRGEAKAL